MEPKRFKICYIASVDSTIRFILFEQLKFLLAQGYDVSAVCSTGKWIKDIEKENIKVNIIRFKRKIFSPISDLVALIKLFFYFRKERFDIVHTHTPKASFLGQLAAKMAGIPIIINTIHGFYFTENTPAFKRFFLILIEKVAAKCSDLIFSVNNEDINTAIKEGVCSAKKIRYLGGWVNLGKFNPGRFSKDFIEKKKEQIGIAKNAKVIGIVARLVREKGYLELFEALKKVIIIFPNAVLLVIGPEEPKKKDRISLNTFKSQQIRGGVIFLGERTDVDEIYPLMDVFVLPSHREGMGLSILEASAMKRVVIGTDIRGCREAIDNCKTGILVPVKNSEELAKAITYLLDNPQNAMEMGKNGRIKIIKEFDERFIFEKIGSEYKALIKQKSK